MVDVRPDNRLAFVDHGLFTQHHAIGRNLVIQCVWLYEHAVDLNGVRRFNHYLARGFLGRRIERSPLPFARAHWVVDHGPDIDIDESPRPRTEVSDWADERSQVPIDPVWGPGWHLGVVSLTDGSTAASLVLSHYLLDGLGLVLALVDGVMGNTRDFGYPPPRSRTRWRAIAQDARQTARDIRPVTKALGIAARQARRQRQDSAQQSAPRAPAPLDCNSDEPIIVPGVTVGVDLTDWDARADALGGTRNTLGAGFAAKFGELIGRRRANDGNVTLQVPVSQRTEGDTRANAMGFARVTLDPTRVTTDLGDARLAIKQALKALRETPDDSLQVAWLAAFTPKRALRRMENAMVADPELPVFYSNLGDVGTVVNRLDGTDAEWATARVTAQNERREWLERIGGLMTLQSLRLPHRFVISVNAYQPGAENTKPALRKLAAQTLAEFDLHGEID